MSEPKKAFAAAKDEVTMYYTFCNAADDYNQEELQLAPGEDVLIRARKLADELRANNLTMMTFLAVHDKETVFPKSHFGQLVSAEDADQEATIKWDSGEITVLCCPPYRIYNRRTGVLLYEKS